MTLTEALTLYKLGKYDEDQPRAANGEWGGGGGSSEKEPVAFHQSAKMLRALNSQVRTGKAEQDIADKSEKVLSAAIGIPRTKDNSAFDVRNDDVGIEIKTLVNSSSDKITMSKTALGRKLAEQRAEGLKGYTVVVDRRTGGMAGNATYYVREGFGSFRLGSMTKVTLGQLKEMVRP